MPNVNDQSPEDLAAMRKVLVAMAEEKGAEAVITMLVDVLGQARAEHAAARSGTAAAAAALRSQEREGERDAIVIAAAGARRRCAEDRAGRARRDG